MQLPAGPAFCPVSHKLGWDPGPPPQAGAARLSMVGVPKDLFVDAVKQTVAANKDFVPPQGKGSLYLRPLLFGSGPILGLGESAAARHASTSLAWGPSPA
jgi:branched-chain amino acid aminotransferase